MPRFTSKMPSTPGGPLQRRFTTLSLETVNRVNTLGETQEKVGGPHGVFTDNISASSRAAPPPFVVRHGTVIGANMPDTVRLSSHRGKVYIGLPEVMSSTNSALSTSTTGHNSRRTVSRGENRDRTSAATTIGRASIIDWTDKSSEPAKEKQALSGELSFLLPPVRGGQKEMLSQPPPGLDTAELLRYRPKPHANSGSSTNRSPPPRSRAGGRPPHNQTQHGGRPPQNTPSRPEDFSASLRKAVRTPRRALGISGVMVLGGGIKQNAVSERWSTQRQQIVLRHPLKYETPEDSPRYAPGERPAYLRRPNKHLANHRAAKGVGRADFELPMIDLKCIESPIADLGNLEEKGIRLVKLRNVRRPLKRKATTQLSESDTTPPDNTAQIDGDEDIGDAEGIDFETARTAPGELAMDVEVKETTVDVEKIISATHRSTTSSTSSSVYKPGDEADNGSVIGTNREPYLTPLLPNITPQDTGRSSLTQQNTHTYHVSTTPPPTALNLPLPFVMTVEKSATPTHLNLETVVNDDDDEGEDDVEVFSASGGPPPATVRRKTRRSSSLLSVPASDTSERRPNLDTPQPPSMEILGDAGDTGDNPDELDTDRITIATQTGGRD